MHGRFSAGGLGFRLAGLRAVREHLPGEKRRRRHVLELLQKCAHPGLELHSGEFVPFQADFGPAGPELDHGPHHRTGQRGAGSLPEPPFYGPIRLPVQAETGGRDLS